jgi:hypothetical protein
MRDVSNVVRGNSVGGCFRFPNMVSESNKQLRQHFTLSYLMVLLDATGSIEAAGTKGLFLRRPYLLVPSWLLSTTAAVYSS